MVPSPGHKYRINRILCLCLALSVWSQLTLKHKEVLSRVCVDKRELGLALAGSVDGRRDHQTQMTVMCVLYTIISTASSFAQSIVQH